MGCGASSSPEQQEQQKASKEIEKEIQKDKKKIKQEVKLLLLGPGESGKSTFAKQMQIIHLNGFDQAEREGNITVVYQNILDSAQKLVRAVLYQFKTNFEEDYEWVHYFDKMDLSQDICDSLSPEVIQWLGEMWQDKAVVDAFNRRAEFQLNESTEYFMSRLLEVVKPDYLPSEEDMLRLRKKTTGVLETIFLLDKLKFRMVDVGGQRNERKKWIHCFEDVTAIIYICAISAYNCLCEEDNVTNRMHEALKLWDDVINNHWFQTTNLIFFMNKADLFEEKIKTVDLNVCFPTYRGGCDSKEARKYIQKKFEQKDRSGQSRTFFHLTCATDTTNAKKVFNDINAMILDEVMAQYGFN